MTLRLFLTSLFAIILLAAAQAMAAQPEVTRIEPRAENGRLVIDADVAFDVGEEVRDAAERGVPLYFTADVIITRSRWWWIDQSVVDTHMTWRVVYNALTRQWRAGSDQLTLPVGTLDDALALMRSIRGWDVASLDDFNIGTHYEGRLRLRLDTSLLPRPFQVNALNSSSWTLATPWRPFDFDVVEKAVKPR